MKIQTTILFLWLALNIQAQDTFKDTKTTAELFYGVRWFLAQAFRYPSHLDPSVLTLPDLMLMFNTQSFQGQVSYYIQIQNLAFACAVRRASVSLTDQFHPSFNNLSSAVGDLFETYIYRCPIRFVQRNYLQSTQQLDYSILASEKGRNTTVFKGVVRSPLFGGPDIKSIVLGDWGKITRYSSYFDYLIPIDECLSSKLSSERVSLMIILGDVGYDLQGQTYIQFLQYLQPYSSQLPIIFTPGNHEFSKHKSIYSLIMQTFYSPYWSQFYGYFQLIALKNHLILGYNPDSLFRNSLFTQLFQKEYGNHSQFLQSRFTEEMIAQISQNYTLVTISHYPMFCSEEKGHYNCSDHQIQKAYFNLIRRLQVDIVFGAHLHYYERSKPVCDDQGQIFLEAYFEDEEKQVYLAKECPIFMIQGAAGNNYYVQTSQKFPLQKYSRKLVYNTGFGVLTFASAMSPNALQFKQVSTLNNCSKVDEFHLSKSLKSIPEKIVYQSHITLISLSLLVLLLIIVVLVYCLINLKQQKNPVMQKTRSVIQLNDVDHSQR